VTSKIVIAFRRAEIGVERASAAVDMLGHRLVHVKRVDLK